MIGLKVMNDPKKPKPINPLLHFALPALESLSLLGWWLYALTHTVHFPGTTVYNDGTTDNHNVGLFNVVLIIILALSWVAAGLYYDWRKKNR